MLLPLHPIWLLPHLGCVEWICQVNGVGLFFHADDHRFAFSTHATHKMYGRVIFELLEICDCVHAEAIGRHPAVNRFNVPCQPPDQGPFIATGAPLLPAPA